MALADVRRDRVWTHADLKELPDDGRRWEIVEGALVEMTGPTTLHGRVVVNLARLLLPIMDALGAEFFVAPQDVLLPDGSVVEPDLLAILPDGLAWPSLRGIEGPPDLVVEVVSPSSRQHFTVTKRALYGRTGVREYWLVDPEARSVDVLVRQQAGLRLHRHHAGATDFVSPLLGGAAFPIAALFRGFERTRANPTDEER